MDLDSRDSSPGETGRRNGAVVLAAGDGENCSKFEFEPRRPWGDTPFRNNRDGRGAQPFLSRSRTTYALRDPIGRRLCGEIPALATRLPPRRPHPRAAVALEPGAPSLQPATCKGSPLLRSGGPRRGLRIPELVVRHVGLHRGQTREPTSRTGGPPCCPTPLSPVQRRQTCHHPVKRGVRHARRASWGQCPSVGGSQDHGIAAPRWLPVIFRPPRRLPRPGWLRMPRRCRQRPPPRRSRNRPCPRVAALRSRYPTGRRSGSPFRRAAPKPGRAPQPPSEPGVPPTIPPSCTHAYHVPRSQAPQMSSS